jgi:hypothetical protein
LKRAIPSNDDLKKPFTFPENKQATTEAYFAHPKAGIPFDKHGIPNPDRALTAPTNPAHKLYVSTFLMTL